MFVQGQFEGRSNKQLTRQRPQAVYNKQAGLIRSHTPLASYTTLLQSGPDYPSLASQVELLKGIRDHRQQQDFVLNLQQTYGNAYVQRVIDGLEATGTGTERGNRTNRIGISSKSTEGRSANIGRSGVSGEENENDPAVAEFISLCRANGVSEEVIQEVSNDPAARVRIKTAIESYREAWKELFTEVLEQVGYKTVSKVLGAVFSVDAAIDKAARGDYRGAASEIVNLGVSGVLPSVAAVSMIANALTALFPQAYGYFQLFNVSNTIDTMVRLISGDFDISPEDYIKLQSMTDAIHNIPILNIFSWTVESIFDLFADDYFSSKEELIQFLEDTRRLSETIRQIFDNGIGVKIPQLRPALQEYYETRISYTYSAETRSQAEGIIMRLSGFASLLLNVVMPNIRPLSEIDNPERYALYIYEQISPYDPPYPVDKIQEGIQRVNNMGSYMEEIPPEEIQPEWFSGE
jgi:hypothetical protein